MSPNRNYKDGYEDGNSEINYYDRKRFQDDDDYSNGVADGWKEKERREEDARDAERQKWQDKYDNAMDYSSNNASYTSNSGNISTPANNTSCVAVLITLFLSFVVVFLTAPFWSMLSGMAYLLAPVIILFSAVILIGKLVDGFLGK